MDTGITLKQSGSLSALATKVERNGSAALDMAAQYVKNMQQEVIVTRVRNFTGNLFLSIDIESSGNKRYIGPNMAQAPYALYIEEGRGSFGGYHFVRISAQKAQQRFENLVVRTITK